MVPSANHNSLIDVDKLPIADRYCVAFSGGVDSTALLIAAAQVDKIKNKLFAVHINHHIQEQANEWALHCAEVCQNLEVPLQTESVHLKSHSENACRQARLNVFKSILTEFDCLLTAHHADDQVETILFRLFRGTGLNGIKGMAVTNNFFGYQNHRPFLSLNKKDLIQYVEHHGIQHITDNSNTETKYRRNYIRNRIIPEVMNYEKDALSNIIRTSNNLTNSHKLLNKLIGNKNPLSTTAFNHHDLFATALYHWLGNLTDNVNVSQKQLLQFSADCIQSAGDKTPELAFGSVKLIKWQNQVYALRNLPSFDKSFKQYHLKANEIIPVGYGSLLLSNDKDQNMDVTVGYQQGSLTISLPNHKISKKIKNLFQENKIPPWIRECVPYIFIKDELMAVGSLFISEPFNQYLKSNNAQFEWVSPQFLM